MSDEQKTAAEEFNDDLWQYRYNDRRSTLAFIKRIQNATLERAAKEITPTLPSWDGVNGKAKYEEALSCAEVIRALKEPS